MPTYNVNRVVLIGRLTRDPELRALPSGTSVCNLRVACNSARRDADGGYQERPNYFDVSVFGGGADTVDRYMRKGKRVAVDGRLEWREWETADLQKRQAVSVVADRVQFLDVPERDQDGEDWDDQTGDDGESSGERELAGVGAGNHGDVAP